MKRLFWVVLLAMTACQSGGQTPAANASTAENPATTQASTSQTQNVESSAATSTAIERGEQPDLSKLSPKDVSVYNYGSTAPILGDILPLGSSSSGYDQKWEFYIYTRPWEVRIKFEISNFAFSKNEAKIRGYVRRFDGETMVEDYKLSKNLKSGQWKSANDRLSLTFGDYTLNFDGSEFHIHGTFEKGDFDFDIPAHFWKPGTGNVIFGHSPENIFKYAMLTYHKPVSRGTVRVDGNDIPVTGQAYANHYATTVAIYDMFDEVADFRKRTDTLLAEFRYYVPSQKYNAEPFGFMFVAAEGVPLVSSTHIERTPVETWLDEDNYGYLIDSRQRIVAVDGDAKACFNMLSAKPVPEDPYADLPAFQRNVATRFAKPIEYSVKINYEIDLDVEGMTAKIPMSGSYSITRLR